jgi:hypothetical protein
MDFYKSPPTGGQAGQGGNGVSEYLNRIIPFSLSHRQGWLQNCTRCGSSFRRPFTSGTLRGAAAELCVRCWLGGGS